MKSYDLKSTPTTEEETLEHLLKILYEKIEDAEYSDNFDDYDKYYKDAEDYLKRYIDELFLQNK